MAVVNTIQIERLQQNRSRKRKAVHVHQSCTQSTDHNLFFHNYQRQRELHTQNMFNVIQIHQIRTLTNAHQMKNSLYVYSLLLEIQTKRPHKHRKQNSFHQCISWYCGIDVSRVAHGVHEYFMPIFRCLGEK